MKHLLFSERLERLQNVVNMRREGRLDNAMRMIKVLLKHHYNESSVQHTFGQLCTDFGLFKGALNAHRTSIEIMTSLGWGPEQLQFRTASLAYAYALMRVGEFETAWPYFEIGRLGSSWTPWPGSEYYNGQRDIDSLLVQCEGGYGDFIQFMRWIPWLKKYKAVKRVGLMAWPSFKGFVSDWSLLGVDEVFWIGEDKIKFGEYKHATSILSLPKHFGIKEWCDIPRRPQWLFSDVVPHAEDNEPHGRLDSPIGIGFCWRSEENGSPFKTKSISYWDAGDIVTRLRENMPNAQVHSLSPKSALYAGHDD